MRQKATFQKKTTAAQQRVIEGLVGGASITLAAKAGRVSRQTVHRWLRDDFEFQANLNAARTNLRSEIDSRLVGLATGAIDAVENALQKSDVSAALGVLKGLGLFGGRQQPPSSESASALRSQAATRELLESI